MYTGQRISSDIDSNGPSNPVKSHPYQYFFIGIRKLKLKSILRLNGQY